MSAKNLQQDVDQKLVCTDADSIQEKNLTCVFREQLLGHRCHFKRFQGRILNSSFSPQNVTVVQGFFFFRKIKGIFRTI